MAGLGVPRGDSIPAARVRPRFELPIFDNLMFEIDC